MVLIYHLNKDSSYYCDYFYQSSGTRYTLRGAHCGYGYSCGSFFIDIHYAVSHNSWSVGASLSFNFLFFYCDYFYQTSGTHYVLRGSRCSDGLNCGFAYVNLDNSFSKIGWSIGATISFKK